MIDRNVALAFRYPFIFRYRTRKLKLSDNVVTNYESNYLNRYHWRVKPGVTISCQYSVTRPSRLMNWWESYAVEYWANNMPLTHSGRDKMAAIFKSIFLNENVWILIKIEPILVSLLMHICVTRPQWVNIFRVGDRHSLFLSLMMSWYGNSLRITTPLWGESTSHRWFPSQRTSNTEL